MDHQIVHRFETKSGLVIHLRELRPSDTPCLVELFEHMGPESRFQRFNIPLADPEPDLVAQEAARLAVIDPEMGQGWLAFADLPGEPGACVAGIRWLYLDDEQGTAEISLAVRDDLQGQGVGTHLLWFMAFRAQAAGVRTLIGYVQSSNRALWHCLKRLRIPLRRELEGSNSLIEVDLAEAIAAYEEQQALDDR